MATLQDLRFAEWLPEPRASAEVTWSLRLNGGSKCLKLDEQVQHGRAWNLKLFGIAFDMCWTPDAKALWVSLASSQTVACRSFSTWWIAALAEPLSVVSTVWHSLFFRALHSLWQFVTLVPCKKPLECSVRFYPDMRDARDLEDWSHGYIRNVRAIKTDSMMHFQHLPALNCVKAFPTSFTWFISMS